jgi:hypothetical protein
VLWAGTVEQSEWIADLERRNRVHSGHNPAWFARLTHFIMDDSSGEAIAAWPADRVGFVAVGLARVWLTRARRAGPAGRWTAGAADAVHGNLSDWISRFWMFM